VGEEEVGLFVLLEENMVSTQAQATSFPSIQKHASFNSIK
jgi:hypothetical protein